MRTRDVLDEKYAELMPHLDERQKRLVAAADAKMFGDRSVSRVAKAARLSRPTVYRGMEELATGGLTKGRTREQGGGRKTLAEKDPRLPGALEALVEPTTSGDPMSPLRWTCKSTRRLAEELGRRGHRASHVAVADMLLRLGYSLQANVKTIEGTDHPDRDAQFRYISRCVGRHLREGQPVISVDTKKKEQVGQYKNAGRTWRREGEAEKVNGHDFADPDVGKAIPYGVYDIGKDRGWVNVGCDADTATFAAESIRGWWQRMGRRYYSQAKQLLITADCGGSNGYRTRLWKVELQRLADKMCMDITVCHFPPGTSKWNKIEHRLFSHISMNWRGRPLVSHEVVVSLIGATTTRTGLRVSTRLDRRTYPKSVCVTDEELANVALLPHTFHGEWNYTIKSKHKHGHV
jgi:hypothetical protein